jgi:hypothetical protein
MTRCVVEAVERSGVCAILTKGWSDRGQRKDSKDSKDSGKGDKEKDKDKDKDTQSLGDEEEMDPSEGADGIKFPDSIYAIDSIDHSWLFPRIDAACHHGGAGTTGASLRAGIPTIIKPFFGDQAFWAERVESLGVGSGIRKLTTDELSDALVQATTNERQIAKAKAVGEEIRRERGVQRAIQCIYRDLEYAKSLIRPLPTPTEERTNVPKKSGSLKRKVRKSISHVFTGPDRDASDESWSIVSDSGHLSQVSSPPGSRRTSNASTWNPIDAPGLASASASATASVSVPASAAASMTMSMPQPPPGSASASAPVSAPISNAASVSTHLSDDDEVYTPSPASGPTSGSTTSTSHRGPIAGLGSLVNHIVGRSRTPDERKN